MIFTTFQFLAFFVVFYLFFLTVPASWRRPLILVASYYFYMCSVPWYLTVIIAITLIDFVAGIRIESAATHAAKRFYLLCSLVANLGLLVVFKYAGFFAHEINDSFGLGVPVLQFVLPLGLSFHTFQAVSYTIEVYRGRVPAERDLLSYAIYVAFFPQMVAGPIERPYNLLPQIHRNPTATYDTFRSGIQIALWGAFKKLVVADFVAQAVTNVYAQPHLFSGPILLFTTFLFSIQIYCDFSGYSDIAIGIGRMMGYELMVNFRQPYFSRSIAEFWRRWHISLSTWFRDYVYLALGGSHVSKARHLVNVLIVFMVSGLWHGANWTFLIWGMLHGLYYIAGSLTAPARARLTSGMTSGWARAGHAAFQMAFTFSLISLAWVFFRAATVSDAMYIVTHFFDWHRFSIIELETMGLPKVGAAMALSFIAIMAIVEWLMAHKDTFVSRLWSSSRTVRWAGYYACVFGIVFFGVFEHVAFIYFQF